jgi:hypothetical protein
MGSLEGKDIISRTDFRDNQSEIFPNPCDRFLICNSQLSQLHRITIVDMQGNITIENIDNSIIDVSSYQPGTYIIYTPKQTYTIKVLR